mmetsp:Transcript_15168/g.45425  ORF Transcript_15168/g.45425 Transcript_15168/m.45425 type:complete len:234 (+) Transcript_15168:456-1157(+)
MLDWASAASASDWERRRRDCFVCSLKNSAAGSGGDLVSRTSFARLDGVRSTLALAAPTAAEIRWCTSARLPTLRAREERWPRWRRRRRRRSEAGEQTGEELNSVSLVGKASSSSAATREALRERSCVASFEPRSSAELACTVLCRWAERRLVACATVERPVSVAERVRPRGLPATLFEVLGAGVTVSGSTRLAYTGRVPSGWVAPEPESGRMEARRGREAAAVRTSCSRSRKC